MTAQEFELIGDRIATILAQLDAAIPIARRLYETTGEYAPLMALVKAKADTETAKVRLTQP